MKKNNFYSKIVWTLLTSFIFQILFMPYLQAQGQGTFLIRGSDTPAPSSADDRGSSFRTVEGAKTPGIATIPGVDSAGVRGGIEGLAPSTRGGEASIGQGLLSGGLVYQIHILGEVQKPGTYRVPASSRLAEVLLLAGIKKNGSERNIEIRKGGAKSGKKVDLFAYKLFGDLEQNPYMMDNEVVFVPLKQKVIEVEGAVDRPGFYELKREKTLWDIIQLAGGFSQGASTKEPVRLIRYDPQEKKTILEIPDLEKDLKEVEVLDRDVIIVPHMFTNENKFDYNVKQFPNDNLFYPSYEDRVFVLGAVSAPGPFTFNQYYKLSNYLAFAGGLNRMSKGYINVMTPDGKTTKVKPNDQNIRINPGDVVYAPEKLLSRETWVNLALTIANLGFSVATTSIVLTR